MSDPCAAPGLPSFEEALARLLDAATPLPAHPMPADEAALRALSAPVHATAALPPFDNAAMDGYALHSAGLQIEAGSVWPVVGQVAAGDAPPEALAGAWEIMTGAPLPPGTDSVVPFEHTTRLDPSRMRVEETIPAHRHIRRAGSDLPTGACIAPAGTALDATARMLLAAAGVGRVQVWRRPRVAILSTGKELACDPAQPLLPGQIRASNGPYLEAALAEAGAEVVASHTLDDIPERFAQRLAEVVAGGVDLILTTGAVSAGIYDFIPNALRQAGARVLFHKAAIRPGKPLLAARLPEGPLVLGLPGNPVATVVGFRFFVVPLLRQWLGLPVERPLRVRLSETARGRAGMRHFLKARVDHDASGQLHVRLLAGQESFRITTLLEANAWATIDATRAEVPAGTLLEVYPRHPDGRWRFD